MEKKLTLEEIKDFRKLCISEYKLPCGLYTAKTALSNFDTLEEQINFVKKLGSPAIGLPEGKHWNEYQLEKLLK